MVKRFTKHILLTFTVILAVVFAFGILLGKSISTAPEDRISRSIQDNELNSDSFLIEQDLFKTLDSEGCNLARLRLTDLSNELGNTGRQLVSEGAEKSLGPENFRYLKRKYHIMQVRAYLMFSKLEDRCNFSSNIILYYYGQGDLGSAEQGHILDAVVQKHAVSVFAIEYNYSPELKFLESYYNISQTPVTVVNHLAVHHGLTTYETLVRDLQVEKDT